MYWGIFVALAFDHKKQEGDRCEYYIILYNRKKKNKKTREGVWVGLYYMKILLVFFFFFKCKVHLQNFTEKNCYDYIYKMKFFNVTRK